MKETTTINTPYEEMHRSFVLRLIELKDERGTLRELREFLQHFVGIRSGIDEVRKLEPRTKNSLRIYIRSIPIIHLDEGKQIKQPQPDWIIDFLFCDSYRDMVRTLDFLSSKEEDHIDAKHALLHFGCSPDSYSEDFARNAFVTKASDYDVFHSIGSFEMSHFLDGAERFGDRLYEAYADIIHAYAKKKAIMTWQKSPRAFSFLCENVIVEELEKKIGKVLLVKTSFLSQAEATVCFTLPHFEWNLFDEEELVNVVYGLTLRVHFIAGEPLAHLGLSHLGPVKTAPLDETPITKELYEKLFFRKFDLSKTRFHWARSIEDPLDDEFAYSNRPVWISDPWENERLYTGLALTPQDLCGRLVRDIAEIFENIEKGC